SGCGGKELAGPAAKASIPERDDSEAVTVKEARLLLEEGNLRFSTGKPAHPDQGPSRRRRIGSGGQKPFVSVLSCADSRVPPELIFDQGLGDLFVVRSAGQVVDRAVLGTLQFGVAEFGTPLLVVLGHTMCGAVKATIEAKEKKTPASGTDIDTLVRAILPSVNEAEELGADEKELVTVAVGHNIERVVEQLRRSKVLALAVKARKLKILGALCDIATGEVEFV
ncbi:MAG TPA: carbonic anhydrase, partial [Kineosporiaceae bacterium]|nr:carbonic anhydrase [Kineosporiaceae bacterium]